MKTDSPLTYALLGLLSQEARSGYDLRKLFSKTPFDRFSDSPGAIYPALRRLAAAGWLQASLPEGGRKRTVFRLTAVGRRRFSAWLRRPPTHDEVVSGLDTVMIRFAFLGGTVSRTAAARFLDAFAREVRAHLQDLRRFRAAHGTGPSTTGQLAFDAGLASYEAYLAWARRARAVMGPGGRS